MGVGNPSIAFGHSVLESPLSDTTSQQKSECSVKPGGLFGREAS